MKRVVIPELLDADSGTPREVEDSLADLRMINRYFGGLHTMTALIHEVATRARIKTISWLDVGGGTGDLAAYTSQALTRQGIDVNPVLLDRMPGHMITSTRVKSTPALETTGSNGHYPSIGGDALALPFQENSFDVVGCCLFVHHLEPQQVIQFVDQALRIARHAVLINDLIRHPLHVALAYAGYAVYRSRITRHDAPASVRRAYKVAEMKDILKPVNASAMEVRHFYLFRMGVILWKKPNTT